MAHQIETNQITGKSEIAYVGKTPWHGLGQQLTKDASIETWQEQAGLSWKAVLSPTMFWPEGEVAPVEMPNQFVIHRNDNKKPLGVVTGRYKVHQPDEILGFFDTLAKSAGFSLEVAGAINGGKRIWALANTNREACVLGDDSVKGYVLLSTSFDGTTSTIGQFTSIRVVCNNTLSAADKENAPSRVSITHGTKFCEQTMSDKLGIITSSFDEMMTRYKYLAHKDVTSGYVKQFLLDLFPPTMQQVKINGANQLVLAESRSYKNVLELFDGKGMGAELKGASGTRWGLLNAVTEYIDHQRGHNADSRMNNAWFGNGNRLKTQAEEILLA
jgi:phage/plasmid-like protein (TIGR03299 family)